MIDVIIPHYGREQLLVTLLKSLLQYEPQVRPIVVNNNPQRLYFAREFLDQFKDWECIDNSKNQGFVRGVNQGLAVSDRLYVVIQNNDTVLYDNALSRMQKLLEAHPKMGAVGPVSGSEKGWQSFHNLSKRWEGWQEVAQQGSAERVARHLIETRTGTVRAVGGMLAFFCTMFRKQALAQTGPLSTEFGLGLGDDDDYCARLRRQGWALGLAEGVLVGHLHRTSFKTLYSEEEIKELQDKAMEIFKRREVERQQGHGPGTWPMS